MANICFTSVRRVTVGAWTRSVSPANPERLLNWASQITVEHTAGEFSLMAIADAETSATLESAYQARVSAENAQLEIQLLANEQARDLAA